MTKRKKSRQQKQQRALPLLAIGGVMFMGLMLMVGAGLAIFLLLQQNETAASIENATDGTPAFAMMTVEDLHFQFAFPEGWVHDVKPGEITLAADEDTLAMELDAARTPTAPTMILNTVPIADEENRVRVLLDDMVALLPNADALTISESFELSVMQRRARTLVVSGADGRHGFATFWLQDGLLYLFTLNLPPDTPDEDYAFLWGQILSSMQPRPAQPLSAPMTLADVPVAFSYPQEYEITSEETPFRVADVEAETSLSVFSVPQADLLAEDTANFTTVTEATLRTLGIQEIVQQHEYLISEQGAWSITGPTAEGVWLRVLFLPVEDEVVFVMFSAPDRAAMKAFEPMWNALMDRMRVV